MPRLTNNFAAVFAAIAITVVSMQVVTSVPAAQANVVEAPLLA